MGLKPQVTVETSWKCGSCGTVRLVPAHLVISQRREDSWADLSELLFASCGNCGKQGGAVYPTVLVEEGGTEGDPGYLLLPVQGTPSAAEIEQGRGFLAERNIPPMLIAGLVPVGWPGEEADPSLSMLPALETDLGTAPLIARHRRRRRVMAVLLNLGAVTSPEQIRDMLQACPELVTDGADAERELRSVLRWPPEGGRLADARAALIRRLVPSVTDAQLKSAYEAFEGERQAGITEIVEAGYRKARWLAEHPDTSAAEWDQVAVQALHLLGLGGDERGRAGLLDSVGTYAVRRPDATQGQVEWAIQCLRDSRNLWLGMGDRDKAAEAGSHLALALNAWDYGDRRATVKEAEAVMRDAMAHYENTQEKEQFAMAATNLAAILLKAANLDQRRDRIQEAVDLCREVLPLRPKTSDPFGWAFCAANLALALMRLGDEDVATRRANLEEAAAVSQEAADILDARGDAPAADQARVNRLHALLGLVDALREERLRAAIGDDETMKPGVLANLLTINPGAFGLAETPPEVAAITRGPAAPDEARVLTAVLAETAAMLRAARTSRDPAARSRLARLTAMAVPKLLGPTSKAADAVITSRCLIDDAVAPDAAATTSGELADLLARLGRWTEAAAAYDACLALNDRMLRDDVDHNRAVEALAHFPTLARWTAYAHLRCGDPQNAVTILERTRSRSLPRFVPGAGRGLELLSWRSATVDDIGQAATPACPIAYVLTAFSGSAVLLVRTGTDGGVRVTAHESTLSSASFVAQMWSLPQPGQGFLTAQLTGEDIGPAIRALMEPLGSLLQPVADELLADGVRDLVLIPAGPSAILPWAAAMVRAPDDSRSVPVGELLNLSVAPSAAAVVLGRERAEGRARDAAAGRILVVADPERRDVRRLPGAQDETRHIMAAFPGRVDVLAGPDARTETVLDMLPPCWAGHMACHGVNDVLQPDAMRLLLSDGDLTMDQLLKLPELRTRLMVLSACQTGHVDIMRASDEMLGMPLAFLQAGACAVVSTLWPVSDRVTAILMGRFYEELATEIRADGSGDVAAALARAQRWLRSLTREDALARLQESDSREASPQQSGISAPLPSPDGDGDALFADPYFWAGFVAYGR